MSVKHSAWRPATGRTSADVSPISLKKSFRPVFGLERFCITGVSASKKGEKEWIASLRSAPRPVRASPKPVRVSCWSWRFFASNVFSRSSNSTGLPAFSSGIVEPALKVSFDLPGWISTYFSPSAERGRTISVESVASGSTVLSSFRSRTATERSLPSGGVLRNRVRIVSTMPTRKPPTRTSLPSTRFAPPGTWAETS